LGIRGVTRTLLPATGITSKRYLYNFGVGRGATRLGP